MREGAITELGESSLLLKKAEKEEEQKSWRNAIRFSRSIGADDD